MPYQQHPNIVGSDGYAPSIDQTAVWKTWNYGEIFLGLGNPAHLKYVPNVGDWVQDTTNMIKYEVTAVDLTTLIPTLQEVSDSVNASIIRTGTYPFTIFVDSSTVPATMACSVYFPVYGTGAAYAKFFRGGDVSQASGKIVSRVYDAAGNFLTDEVPLELVDPATAVKSVAVCHTNETFRNGELVTVVIYTATGAVHEKVTMVVENSSYIRDIAAGTKYIKGLELISPFVSTINPNLIEYPVNVPMNAFNLDAFVHYSDGSKVKLPVNGSPIALLGLTNFVATIPDQTFELALRYQLQPGEVAYGDVYSEDGKHISVPYQLHTMPQNNAYTVKIYGYPEWIASESKYAMRYYLMDLNRNVLLDVTRFVQYNATNPAFDGTAYGVVQNLSIRVNLKNVSASLKNYIHTQTFQLVLERPGDEPDTRWTIGFKPNQTPFYGIDLFADVAMINHNLWDVQVASGHATLDAWLDSVYYATHPLYDKKREDKPLRPTHFNVLYNNARTEFAIGDWNKTLSVGAELILNGTVFIEFLRRTGTEDLQLGVSGLAIRQA